MSGAGAAGAVVMAHPRGSVLAVTVTPRSARTQIEPSGDGPLRVRVTAPPVNGAANAAVLRLLAEVIGVPRSQLELVTGESARRKRILVRGLDPDELTRRLQGTLDKKS